MRKFALVLTLTLAVGAVAPTDVHAARGRSANQPVMRDAGEARDRDSIRESFYRLLLRIANRLGPKSLENPVVPHP